MLTDSTKPLLNGVSSVDPGIAGIIAVVSNKTDHPITAISGTWTIEKIDGSTQPASHKCNVFIAGVNLASVSGPHSRLLFGPHLCLSEESLLSGDRSAFINGVEKQLATSHAEVRSVKVHLDAVMFGDGEMYAETDTYARDIEARVSSAKKFSEFASTMSERSLQGSKSDMMSSLESIQTNTNAERMWLQAYAQGFKAQPPNRSARYVQRFANIRPVTINLHRLIRG